jgi:hypothetical protein
LDDGIGISHFGFMTILCALQDIGPPAAPDWLLANDQQSKP